MFSRFRQVESRQSQVHAVAPPEEVVASAAADPSVPGSTGVRSAAADRWEEDVAEEAAAREGGEGGAGSPMQSGSRKMSRVGRRGSKTPSRRRSSCMDWGSERGAADGAAARW